MSWEIVESERGLYTVGHYLPYGDWFADADFDSIEEADERLNELTGWRGEYVYVRSEPQLYTVGFFDSTWNAHSDHESMAEARAEVIRLNN